MAQRDLHGIGEDKTLGGTRQGHPRKVPDGDAGIQAESPEQSRAPASGPCCPERAASALVSSPLPSPPGTAARGRAVWPCSCTPPPSCPACSDPHPHPRVNESASTAARLAAGEGHMVLFMPHSPRQPRLRPRSPGRGMSGVTRERWPGAGAGFPAQPSSGNYK